MKGLRLSGIQSTMVRGSEMVVAIQRCSCGECQSEHLGGASGAADMNF